MHGYKENIKPKAVNNNLEVEEEWKYEPLNPNRTTSSAFRWILCLCTAFLIPNSVAKYVEFATAILKIFLDERHTNPLQTKSWRIEMIFSIHSLFVFEIFYRVIWLSPAIRHVLSGHTDNENTKKLAETFIKVTCLEKQEQLLA